MPEGTPVLAARDGVVMTVDNDFYGNGQDMAKYGDRANNIRIVHSDGTMAVYAHLQLESARCRSASMYAPGRCSRCPATPATRAARTCISACSAMRRYELVSVPFKFSGAQRRFHSRRKAWMSARRSDCGIRLRSRKQSPTLFIATPYYNGRFARTRAARIDMDHATANHMTETQRRRTFAIISHPDAGKTTLTEKLLLFGGAIQMAGSVKSRKATRARDLATGWRWRRNAAFRSPRR